MVDEEKYGLKWEKEKKKYSKIKLIYLLKTALKSNDSYREWVEMNLMKEKSKI